MAEDNGDKTEAPTPRRRQQAAEEGNVARSQDLVAAALVVGAMLLLNAYGAGVVQALRTLLARDARQPSRMSDFSDDGAAHGLLRAVALAGRALAPLFVGLLLIAAVGNFLQVGLPLQPGQAPAQLRRPEPVRRPRPALHRPQPRPGGDEPAEVPAHRRRRLLRRPRPALARSSRRRAWTSYQIFGLGASVVYAIALRIGLALLVLAILDYAYQRYRIEQDLKMTKQEVKDEMRNMDGDPKLKQRRRQIAMQIASGKLKKDVPTADVVVTNPTEFAVALKYDADAMHAPRVIAKGQGLIAARIREIAIEAGVPILERKPLARALYKLVEVGQEIPEQFYSAVAEILAYVYELSGKRRERQSGSALVAEAQVKRRDRRTSRHRAADLSTSL